MRYAAYSGFAPAAFFCALGSTSPALAQTRDIPLVLAQLASPQSLTIALVIVALAVTWLAIDLFRNRPVDIDVEDARRYARLTLPLFVLTKEKVQRLTSGIPANYLDDWKIGNFAPTAGPGPFEDHADPLNLYDVDGRLLFREFTYKISEKKELRARTAATNNLGAPVRTIGVNAPHPPLAPQLAAALATASTHGLVPDTRTFPVLYADPHLGLLCRDSRGRRVVVDLVQQTLHRVDKKRTRHGASLEGRATWSPRVRSGWREWFLSYPRRRRFNKMIAALEKHKPSLADPPAVEHEILEVPIIKQDHCNWCAAACAEMILIYHFRQHLKQEFTVCQQDIAIAMAVTQACTEDEGASNEDQMEGYRQITGNQVVPVLDCHPTFHAARSEIEKKLPHKNAMEGHARVTAGYSTFCKGRFGDWLYIIDPNEDGPYNFHKEFQNAGILNHLYVRPP